MQFLEKKEIRDLKNIFKDETGRHFVKMSLQELGTPRNNRF